MADTAPHLPVMLPEVLDALAANDDAVYVDATFGAGGYSRAILQAARCKLYAIDRDPSVQQFAESLKNDYPDRFCLITGCFSDMVALLAEEGIHSVDGIVMDLGVSSMQLDQAERGFSFQKDGPLDMRQSQQGMTAADAVNSLDEKELADILYRYGEERQSRRIARAIVAKREEEPFTTTQQLAELIREVIPRDHKANIDPATRSFQALRLYVNRELEELESALEAAKSLLKDQGRLVVVSFHSLEDRIAKQFLRNESQTGQGGSRHLPELVSQHKAAFALPQRKAIAASEVEAKQNPRARSAKLRWAVRCRQEVAA